MSLIPSTLAASTTAVDPAGGAPLMQLVIATVFAGSMTGAVLLAAWLHRSGRTQLLTRLGDYFGKQEGLPGWAVIPSAIGWGSLSLAFLGVYWDISLHLDNGRDPGPLANLAHYPILIGLQGLFLAGVLALVMPKPNAYIGPSAVRVGKGWRVPVSSVTLMACATLGYLGFPLDDVWHRLFGQDVTLWGPTHLMMISGAVLSIIALALLFVEGTRAYGPPTTFRQRFRRGSEKITVPMAMLIASSLFLAEWDWGVQQYLMIWQPLIMAASAGLALVLARRWGGMGAAITVAVLYTVVRFGMNLVVGVGFGQSQPTLPLYLAEALVVEAVWAVPAMRRRTVLPLLLTGLGIGTIGFAAQYGWSQIAMPTAWNAEILPLGIPFAIVGGTAGATLGLLFAMALRGELARIPNRRTLGGLSTAALFALAGLAGNQDYSSGGIVTTTISDARQVSPATGDGPLDSAVRDATITVRFQDPAEAEKASYVSVVAWQGGGMVSEQLKEIAPGVYRTENQIPLGGSWKSLVRTQQGRRMLAAPISLPADPAIPVGAHVNPGTETLQLRTEQQYLQRERKTDVPVTLWGPAIVGVLGTMGLFAVALGFATARVGLRTRRDPATAGSDSEEAAGTARRPGSGPQPTTRVAYGPSDR